MMRVLYHSATTTNLRVGACKYFFIIVDAEQLFYATAHQNLADDEKDDHQDEEGAAKRIEEGCGDAD